MAPKSPTKMRDVMRATKVTSSELNAVRERMAAARVAPEPLVVEPISPRSPGGELYGNWIEPNGEKYKVVDAKPPKEGPDLEFFSEDEERKVGLTDVHLAATHVCLHNNVTRNKKFFFWITSVGCVSMQCTSMMAIIQSADVLTRDAMHESLTDAKPMVMAMILMVVLVMSFSVQNDMNATRVSEVMIRTSFVEQVGEFPDGWPSRAWRFWGFTLLLFQKWRHEFFLPLCLASAPILAIENNVNSYQIALNSLAVLFVLDVDDQLFSYAYSTRQRATLESVSLSLPEKETRVLDVTNLLTAFLSLVVCIVPLEKHISQNFFRGLEPLSPPPRTPCIMLAMLVVFVKTYAVLGNDIYRARIKAKCLDDPKVARVGKAEVKILYIELALTIFVQILGIMLVLIIQPLGNLLVGPSPPPPPTNPPDPPSPPPSPREPLYAY